MGETEAGTGEGGGILKESTREGICAELSRAAGTFELLTERSLWPYEESNVTYGQARTDRK